MYAYWARVDHSPASSALRRRRHSLPALLAESRPVKQRLILLLIALSVPLAAHAAPDGWARHARNVEIIRDDWGIAHVYAKSDADAVFGMIYAQAEDDFNR